MNPETIEKAKNAITEIGDAVIDFLTKLGVPIGDAIKTGTEWVWPKLILQNYVYAINDLIIVGVLLFAVKALKKTYVKKRDMGSYERLDDDNIVMAFSFAFALICSIAAVIVLLHAVPRIVNPEWQAMLDTINHVKAFKGGS